ncbi:MAG: hypothetical protein RL417_2117 [Pseudomonadota bacterium]|jgi:hypothetical protein
MAGEVSLNRWGVFIQTAFPLTFSPLFAFSVAHLLDSSPDSSAAPAATVIKSVPVFSFL